MKEELMKLLPDLKQAVEQGIAYAGDLFNRAVIYYKTITYVGISVSSLILISGIIYFISTYRWVHKKDDDGYERNDWEDRLTFNILFAFLIPISFVAIICFICDLIKLNTIPELYILQILTI